MTKPAAPRSGAAGLFTLWGPKAGYGHLCESSKTYLYPRGLAGPEIVRFWGGLNGPLLRQNPLEKVGGEAPHLFQWVLRYEGAVWTPNIGRFPARPAPGEKDKVWSSHGGAFFTYLTFRPFLLFICRSLFFVCSGECSG